MKKVFAFIFFGLGMVASTELLARVPYYNELNSQTQGFAKTQKCLNCHVQNGFALNSFGKDFVSIFRRPDLRKFPGIDKMSRQELWNLLLLNVDSNKNKASNMDEIKMGKNPGI